VVNKTAHLEKIVVLCEALEKMGLQPVLVGGIALVILGSQRVTKDFDFLVSRQGLSTDDLVEVFYKHHFELVTKFNKVGEVLRTIANPKIAAIKLRSGIPDSIFFFDWETRLKVDLLLDFPLPARDVARRATKVKIKPYLLRIASLEDLLRLKEMAYADRRSAADAQDLEFLNRMLQRGNR
jgi:predicted nucleotidyltransferase